MFSRHNLLNCRIILIIFLFKFFDLKFSQNKIPKQRSLFNIITLTPGLKVSKFINDFQKLFNHQNDTRTTKENSLQFKENIHIVQNTNKYSISLPRYLNSSIPAHDYFIKGISKNNIKLDEYKNYAYNISYSDKLITNLPRPIVRYPRSKINRHFDLEFQLNQPDIIPRFKSEYFFNLTNIVSINNLLIGTCFDDNLQLYHYYRLGLEELNITDFFKAENNNGIIYDITKKKIKSIIVDSNSKKNERFVLFTDFEDNILIYKISSFLKDKEGYVQRFSMVVNIKDYRLKEKKIVDLVNKDNTFFLGLENDGIIIISNGKITQEMKTFIEGNQTINLKVKDIQEINDSIYVLISGFGLKILDNRDLNNLKFGNFTFKHPYIEKIEIHRNPHFSQYFLGVLISSRFFIEGSEFFIEFDLTDEFLPKINRIYLYDKIISVTNILNDDYFTYIFENNSNKFLVLSRSATANDYNSIFEIHVESLVGSNLISLPFMFTDEFRFFPHIGLLGNNNFIYTKSVELTSSEVTFYFWESGDYEIIFYTFTDFCGDSITETKKCKIDLRYQFDVSLLPNHIEKLQEKLYYFIVAAFVLYNIICLLAFCFIYTENSKFVGLDNNYDTNVQKISSRSIDENKSVEQVIEMN